MKKGWIILAIVVFLIALGFFGVRYFVGNTVSKTLQQENQKVLLIQITETNKKLANTRNSTYLNTSDLDAMSRFWSDQNSYYGERFHELAYEGGTALFRDRVQVTCQDGSSFIVDAPVPNVRFCATGIRATLPLGQQVENITPSQSSGALVILSNNAVLLSVDELLVYSMAINQNAGHTESSPAKVLAHTLGMVSSLQEIMVADATILNTFNEIMIPSFHTDLPVKNVSLQKLDKFIQQMDVPTNEAILAAPVKENCLALLKSPGQGGVGEAISKMPTILSVLMLKPTPNQLCSQMDWFQKTQASKMLADSKGNPNPLYVLMTKTYLNLFVQCNSEIMFPSSAATTDESASCVEKYRKKLKQDIYDAI